MLSYILSAILFKCIIDDKPYHMYFNVEMFTVVNI